MVLLLFQFEQLKIGNDNILGNLFADLLFFIEILKHKILGKLN